MRRAQQKRRKWNSPIVVALVLSLLLHQLFITVMSEFWPSMEVEPPEPQEVMLVQSPPAPPEPPAAPVPEPPVPEPVKPRKIKPVPKPRPEPVQHVKQIEPVQEAEPPAGPPSELATAPPSGPTPSPEKKVNLDLNWNAFERTFGQKAEEDREAYVQESLVRRRGSGSFGKMTARVRRALTTNRGWVRPGNQEPLGDRRQIFYRYIDRIHHEKIHPIFADSFWASLSNFATGHPLNDFSLKTVAEFEIFANGKISEVRVTRTSGNMVFDAAAVDSIYRSSPFPTPPKAILSWNDRVYLRWGFYRSQRICGVMNVSPFILKAPGSGKEEVDIQPFLKDDG